jgi:hypothetical protein
LKKNIPAYYEGMPQQMKVGNFWFAIELISQEASELAGSFGACNLRSQLITLADNMTPQNLADTLLHELLHAIHWVADVDDEADEEQFTLMTAHGLCQLWQDNPEEMLWWSQVNTAVRA